VTNSPLPWGEGEAKPGLRGSCLVPRDCLQWPGLLLRGLGPKGPLTRPAPAGESAGNGPPSPRGAPRERAVFLMEGIERSELVATVSVFLTVGSWTTEG
jgi:hypothetical protein